MKYQYIKLESSDDSSLYIENLNNAVSEYCKYARDVLIKKEEFNKTKESELKNSYISHKQSAYAYRTNVPRNTIDLYNNHIEDAKRIFRQYNDRLRLIQ